MRRLIVGTSLVLASFGLIGCGDNFSSYHAIDTHFGTGHLGSQADSVAHCESMMNPKAVSSTNDHGLFQINETTWNKPYHHDPVAQWIGKHWGSVYDPYVNAQMARLIYDKYGWSMWSCRP